MPCSASSVQKHSGYLELQSNFRFMSIHELASEMEINIGHPSGINAPPPKSISHTNGTAATPTSRPTVTISLISQAPHATSTPLPTQTPSNTINYTPPAIATPKTPDTTLGNFDVALDERIGYWTTFGDEFDAQLSPPPHYSVSSTKQKRLFGIKVPPIIAKAASQAAAAVVRAAKAPVQQLVQQVKQVAAASPIVQGLQKGACTPCFMLTCSLTCV
jgi:hypothetical protein